MEMRIRLTSMEQVREFVAIAEKYDFDIDIAYNRVVIDAKSVLGILSMDLSKPLTVTCNGDGSDFFEQIGQYAVQDAVA